MEELNKYDDYDAMDSDLTYDEDHESEREMMK